MSINEGETSVDEKFVSNKIDGSGGLKSGGGQGPAQVLYETTLIQEESLNTNSLVGEDVVQLAKDNLPEVLGKNTNGLIHVDQRGPGNEHGYENEHDEHQHQNEHQSDNQELGLDIVEQDSDYYDEEDPIEYGLLLKLEGENPSQYSLQHGVTRKLSKMDANSIVGGDTIADIDFEDHPISDPSKSTQDQSKKVAGTDFGDSGDVKLSPNVFSFSLPFGGLTSIRSNIYKQFQSLKIDTHLPKIGGNQSDDQLKQEMRLKLERQQSISTLEDASYFKRFKGTDAARFRAVKSSLAANINEFLPGLNKKEENPNESIFNEIDGNIVILGGYRGSILRDTKTKKRVWIPIKAGFNLRKINLLLGPTKEDEINASKYIYPDGVLKNVGPIDICKKLIKKLESNPKTNVKEFGYDWRLSGDIISKQLEDFLKDIYDKTGKPTLVIAHSMGGLMAHGTMQRNPHLFRSVVYVGVPSECLNILGPIRFGDSVIFSDKILTYETNFMMRSSFNFLPLSGRVFVNQDTNEYYDLDYFNPDTWVEYNLNPLVSKRRKLLEEQNNASLSSSNDDSSLSFPSMITNKLKHYRTKTGVWKVKFGSDDSTLSSSTTSLKLRMTSSEKSDVLSSGTEAQESTVLLKPQGAERVEDYSANFSFTFEECYNYLSETLKLAKKFILSLDYREELAPEYPPMAIVYGNAVPSVRGSNVRSIQDIEDGNYYEFFYGHGDGVVHQRWLMPEKKGFKYYNSETGEGEIVAKIASSCGHVNLMTDFRAMGTALRAVFDAEKIWKEKQRIQREKRKNINLKKVEE